MEREYVVPFLAILFIGFYFEILNRHRFEEEQQRDNVQRYPDPVRAFAEYLQQETSSVESVIGRPPLEVEIVGTTGYTTEFTTELTTESTTESTTEYTTESTTKLTTTKSTTEKPTTRQTTTQTPITEENSQTAVPHSKKPRTKEEKLEAWKNREPEGWYYRTPETAQPNPLPTFPSYTPSEPNEHGFEAVRPMPHWQLEYRGVLRKCRI